MSLALVYCQAREKTEPLIGRRESKKKSTGKKTWCQARERIEALLCRLENKEKNVGKMNWSQSLNTCVLGKKRAGKMNWLQGRQTCCWHQTLISTGICAREKSAGK